LNVKYRIGDIALLEHVLALVEFENRLPGSDFREKRLRIELVVGGHGQQAAPLGPGSQAAASVGDYFRKPPGSRRLDRDCPQFYREVPAS